MKKVLFSLILILVLVGLGGCFQKEEEKVTEDLMVDL